MQVYVFEHIPYSYHTSAICFVNLYLIPSFILSIYYMDLISICRHICLYIR